jgi:hypothetical protein
MAGFLWSRAARVTGAAGRDAGHVAGRLARLGWRAAAALVVTVTLAAASPAGPGSRTLSATPAGPTFKGGLFNGVSSVSATDAWAVGEIGSGRTLFSLAARWNGTGWARVPSPSPGGRNAFSNLSGVSAVPASGAWAVGSYGTGLDDRTLVLGWNGTRWAQVPSPSPGFPSGPSNLSGVSAVSASGAWAVGSYGLGSFAHPVKTLVLSWNGTRWAQVPSPSPGGVNGSQLLGVTAAPGSAWAVGSADGATLALRWNGSRWARVPTPSPGASATLNAVTAVSSSDVWAVGWTALGSASGPHRTLVLHWDGTRWARVASPSPPAASSGLNGISAISAASAWAVGDAVRKQNATALILHWNGARWVTVPGPSQGFSILSGVSEVSARDALAVGTAGTGLNAAALALRWNGSRWVSS